MQQAVRVNVRRRMDTPGGAADIWTDLARAEALAKLMDAQFEVAGLKLGADAIIGLVPVAGDALSFAIGMYPVYIARKHKLGRRVIARMMLNLGIDFVIGSIPVAGDFFDVLHKANLKNLALLQQAVNRVHSRG
jgi:hypothetical protein